MVVGYIALGEWPSCYAVFGMLSVIALPRVSYIWRTETYMEWVAGYHRGSAEAKTPSDSSTIIFHYKMHQYHIFAKLSGVLKCLHHRYPFRWSTLCIRFVISKRCFENFWEFFLIS